MKPIKYILIDLEEPEEHVFELNCFDNENIRENVKHVLFDQYGSEAPQIEELASGDMRIFLDTDLGRVKIYAKMINDSHRYNSYLVKKGKVSGVAGKIGGK